MAGPGSPTLVRATRAHRGEVACLDMSGARLATGGGEGALRVWRWAAGAGWAPLAEAARAHRYGVTAARWAEGGAALASGGVDGVVRVWAGGALRCRRVLAAPGGAGVRALCWAGGARLAAGHDDGAVRVWAARRGVALACMAPHEGAVHALASLARHALLLSACTHGTLKVFDLNALCAGGGVGAEVAPLVWVDEAHDLGALCADGTRDGRHAATGGRDARVRVWTAGGGGALAPVRALAGHTAAVTAVRWAEDGRVLASASLDRSARLWAAPAHAAGGACLHVLVAHPRYLTCVALAKDLSYLLTGSNDKSIRTWSLGAFALDTELHAPCNALAHFALGDLEGIGPLEAEEDCLSEEPAGEGPAEEEGGGGMRCVWRVHAHAGAINCIAAHGAHLATASSDGTVKVWRWAGGDAGPAVEHVLEAHRYPALAADFGAAGSVLLTGGLDGAAYLWDVQTGVQVRSLCVPGGEAAGGGGGGGVRDARLAPSPAPSPAPAPAGALRALLATDDGLAPLYRVADPDPQPSHVYRSGGGGGGGGGEAALCCAWSADGAVCAAGDAGGVLQVFAPPAARALHRDAAAHDLGVTSCDFPPARGVALPAGRHLLATAGNDSMIKFWTIQLLEEDSGEARALVTLSCSVQAHGGAVSSVRWSRGEGALLATAGDDRWVRVWRLAAAADGSVRVAQCAAIAVEGAGGAAAALPLRHPSGEADASLVAVGALSGWLALWAVSSLVDGDADGARDDEEPAVPRSWGEAAVARWLADYVTRVPECRVSRAAEEALLGRVRDERVTGVHLLDSPVGDLLATLGYGEEIEGDDESEAAGEDAPRAVVRARLVDEITWLREDPPADHLARLAPHSLLCPLTHRLLRWPASAADGFTYERDSMLEWLLAAPPEGAVSPMTGRRLRNTRLVPNHKLRRALRDFLMTTDGVQPP